MIRFTLDDTNMILRGVPFHFMLIILQQQETMLSPRLSRVVLMVRGTEGVAAAANFYHKALGLALHRVTDDWAELAIGNEDLTLHVQATYGEGQLSTGYSPVLTFEVANMDQTIAACAQAGAHLDGPIQYPAYGKVAAMRAPDGHMIGLFEPSG